MDSYQLSQSNESNSLLSEDDSLTSKHLVGKEPLSDTSLLSSEDSEDKSSAHFHVEELSNESDSDEHPLP